MCAGGMTALADVAVRLVTHLASGAATASCFRGAVPKLPGATRQKLQVGLSADPSDAALPIGGL